MLNFDSFFIRYNYYKSVVPKVGLFTIERSKNASNERVVISKNWGVTIMSISSMAKGGIPAGLSKEIQCEKNGRDNKLIA